MTHDELLNAAKLRVRKTLSDSLDADVQRLIDTAIADLKRIGIHETYLEAPEDPLIVEAVLNYVKANYSIDANYDRLIGCYNMTLTKIKGDGKYKTAAPTPEAGTVETEPAQS